MLPRRPRQSHSQRQSNVQHITDQFVELCLFMLAMACECPFDVWQVDLWPPAHLLKQERPMHNSMQQHRC